MSTLSKAKPRGIKCKITSRYYSSILIIYCKQVVSTMMPVTR